MAQKGVQLDAETFSCSICLEVLKDPVTIPCGHSYCMSCIKAHFDMEDKKGVHSCPQCRERFRPVLVRNTMLAALVEQLKKTGLRAAPADHCYVGPEDVACDFCSGRKLRASKSCLSCVASYCEEHLQPHYESPPFKKHKLVEPSKKLQENICSVHDEVKKLFCRTDQKSICVVCEGHKGHHAVSAAAERTERQRELEGRRQQIQQRIQDTQKDVDLLQQEVEAIDQSADKTVADSEKMFTELIRLIRKQQVRSQQRTAVRGVKELQQKLEQEITELQQLSHTEDHVQFQSPHTHSASGPPLRYFEDVTAAVSELTDILTQDWTKVSLAAAQPDVLLTPEPESRADFLRWSRKITLDPNTAHRVLLLSKGNRKAKWTGHQSYPDHPDRFTDWSQVLSRESLTGRCYWEVERRGWDGVGVAVTYKNISREGHGSQFGWNDKSWSLYYDDKACKFSSNSIKTSLSAPPSSRVGVYLDPRAGILSFYSVSGTSTLLHRVQTTFTQPLYAGLCVYSGCSAELCELR
ncbi:LOW QUALITY PROTEIN: tripartite motif-containing protein 16-like [Menidia menidia]